MQIETEIGFPPYSVLMSVYHKEEPAFLKEAIESMLSQTVQTDNFVLVCDGALTEELDKTIAAYEEKLHIIRLPNNKGLAYALNIGIKQCKNELIARMDSDDISMPHRCEQELSLFEADSDLAIVSGTLLEFSQTPDHTTGERRLPSKNEDIVKYSHRRCPFNHPAVMFRKSEVERAGGYQTTYRMEDYDLWIRMLQQGSKAANITEPILYMRTLPDMYMRRGGRQYAVNMLKLRWSIYQRGWSSLGDFAVSALPQAVICVLPNGVRKLIYTKLLH